MPARRHVCRPRISPSFWRTPQRCAPTRSTSPTSERRQAEGKDTGRVRFLDAGFEISADLPKRVEWDRGHLAAAIETLRSWGEDPADYVATEIKVPESRFTAWPPKLQALFQPARTVGTGRPSYSLEQVEC